jgi:hypothetical protein
VAALVAPLPGLAIIRYVRYEMDRLARLIGACWIGLGSGCHGVLHARAAKPLELKA